MTMVRWPDTQGAFRNISHPVRCTTLGFDVGETFGVRKDEVLFVTPVGGLSLTTQTGGRQLRGVWGRAGEVEDSRLLGRFFAARREQLRRVAARLGVHHLANLGGCLER